MPQSIARYWEFSKIYKASKIVVLHDPLSPTKTLISFKLSMLRFEIPRKFFTLKALNILSLNLTLLIFYT